MTSISFRPAAAQRLGELLGDRGEHLRLHPWALHVPGVLFAEHGHQHHAAPAAHAPPRRGGRPHPLAPSPLTVWAARQGGPLGAVVAVGSALASARAAERRAGGRAYRRLVGAEAARLGLRPEAAHALWRASRFRLVPTVAGTGGRVLRRRIDAIAPRRAPRRAPNLAAAGPPSFAAEVAATLTAHGTPVAWYVRGHTHRAAAPDRRDRHPLGEHRHVVL